MMDPVDGALLHTRAQRRRRSRCTNWVMPLICMFVSGLSLVASLVYTQLTVASVREETDLFKRQVMARLNQFHSNGTEAFENIIKSPEERLSPRNPRSPKKTNPPPKKPSSKVYPPYIHLTGKDDLRKQEYKGEYYFLWEVSPNSPGTQGFHLEHSDDGKSYYKIGIKESGVYLVYSQVAVHGKDNVSQPYECSHETVRIIQDRTQVLLKSLVTQYNLGGKFQGSPFTEQQQPMDTKLHMGVFLLHNDDFLAVRVPKSCDSMDYYMPESYFGVVKIGGKPTKKPVQGATKTSHKTQRPLKSEA